jgi:hypothetical protein
VAAAAIAALAGGCASVPTGGAVHVGSSPPPPPQQQPLLVIAPRPYPGESPEAVVSHFLEASASFAENNAAARLFLTSDAAADWNPKEAGVTVYDSGGTGEATPLRLTPDVSGTKATVTMTATGIARIGADGAYRVAAGPLKKDIPLTKTSSGWRITSPPPRLLLTDLDLARSYQALNVYFLSRSGRFVVPDRIYLQAPAGGTATALIRSLLHGPSSWLSDAVRTAVPAGTDLLGNVAVHDGAAEVPLSTDALSASDSEQKALAAQIVFTLRQLTSVTDVRITAGGAPLPAVQPSLAVADYDRKDPTDVPAKLRFVYTFRHRLRTGNGKPVHGPLGRDDRGLHDVAISADGRYVAGIVGAGGRQGLLVGHTDARGSSIAVQAGKLTPPSYDRAGRMWTVATTGVSQRVYVVARSGEVITAGAADLLSRGTVSQLQISPDGARAVAVVGGKLMMGQVTGAAASPKVKDFRSINPPGYTHAGDVAWSNTDQVEALMRGGDETAHAHEVLPVTVSVDGSDPDAGSALPARPRQIAAAPNENALVAAGAKIYTFSGSSWKAVRKGGDPAYPG